jgi:hypothetical protein
MPGRRLLALGAAVVAAGVSLAACGDAVTQRQIIGVVAAKQFTPGARVFINGYNSELDLNGHTRTQIGFSENCYQSPTQAPKWFCSAAVTYGAKFYAFAGYLDNPGDGDLASLQTQGATLHVTTIGNALPGQGGAYPYKMELILTP